MTVETDLDEDIKRTAFDCLLNVRQAFSFQGLTNQWQQTVASLLNDNNLNPLRMMSGYVRPIYRYSILDIEEMSELKGDVRTLLEWLQTIDLNERDFVRGALVEGLKTFLFRISKVGYFGWPSSMNSLRAVITAYMVLERGMPAPNEEPSYEAVVKKTGAFLRKTFDSVKFVKDTSEVGDWILRAYGAMQLVGHATPSIAGLLTHAAA